MDECNASGRFSGCRITEIPAEEGKLTVDLIRKCMGGRGDVHNSQPKVVSITQPTEFGTLYSADEIKKICSFSHENGMLVHMDGARISNAAVALNLSFKEFTKDCGVDVLSFGGTKNGMMYGEAVVFLRKEIGDDFEYIQKQSTQLISKMRYISAQFSAFFNDYLWKKNAENANNKAKLLSKEITALNGVELAYPCQTNGVFVKIPKRIIPLILDKYQFYVTDEEKGIIRLMCSFDTREEDVKGLAKYIKEVLNG